MRPSTTTTTNNKTDSSLLRRKEKETDIRRSNILAARSVADVIRTSLGPKGMDKMIKSDDGQVLITNDGATILQKLKVHHPAAKMMQQLSRAQDLEAGDGTTSVVIVAGSLLASCETLLSKGIHASVIADAFLLASTQAETILENMSTPIRLEDHQELVSACATSLSSKVVAQESNSLATLAVDAILRIWDPSDPFNVDINDRVRVVERVGGTIDETEIVDGLVFKQGLATGNSAVSDAVRRIENAKILLIQFHLSAPKTDLEHQVVVKDYSQMDRAIMQEKKHILGLCKKIKDTGANVVLLQKSILRDATNELSLHFLNKFGILVVQDVERADIEFICRTVGCSPVAHVDSLPGCKLGSATLVEEFEGDQDSKMVKILGVPNPGRTVSILVRGSNKLVLAEAARSLHDALCVVRSIVKRRFIIVGGGAPEAEMALRLSQYALTLSGQQAFCVKAFADALEIIPYTLAENAGLSPLHVVTELRKLHAEGASSVGIDVKRGCVSDLQGTGVVQPLLVSSSIISLAAETVRMILKVDDLVATR
jgi:T-complex protein 1 subunit delta